MNSSSRYLIGRRICFLVLCTGAALASTAILIYRPKMVQQFEQVQQQSNESTNGQVSPLFEEHKAHYTAMLDFCSVINLANALTALLDAGTDNFLVKFAFITFLYLSLGCSCHLALCKVPFLTLNDIFTLAHYIMVGEFFFTALLLLSILLAHRRYFDLMQRLFIGKSGIRKHKSGLSLLLSGGSMDGELADSDAELDDEFHQGLQQDQDHQVLQTPASSTPPPPSPVTIETTDSATEDALTLDAAGGGGNNSAKKAEPTAESVKATEQSA